MSMKLCVLASGSSGNCTFIGTETTRILIDAGLSARKTVERLVEIGVVPYYLHLLDRVRGTSHYEVSEEEARRLHRGLQETLPGYAVPRLVREIPGKPAKTWLL